LPVAARRAAYVREGGQCAFVSRRRRALPGAARGFIEFDHVKPFAKRGSADAEHSLAADSECESVTPD